jgi:hypothetical protein
VSHYLFGGNGEKSIGILAIYRRSFNRSANVNNFFHTPKKIGNRNNRQCNILEYSSC